MLVKRLADFINFLQGLSRFLCGFLGHFGDDFFKGGCRPEILYIFNC